MILAVPLALVGLIVVTLSTLALWRYAYARRGEARPALVVVPPTAHTLPRHPAEDMFRVPDGLWYHPGHAWARPHDGNAVTIGIDDFARQLMGPLVGVLLPQPGAAVEQGVPAMTLEAGGQSVDVLAPVTGRVRAVNPAALGAPTAVNDDPYGTGWLLEIDAAHLGLDIGHLKSGLAARAWTSASWEELSAMLTPRMGTIMHDGGTPVDGFARAIDPERWPEIVRHFLRT